MASQSPINLTGLNANDPVPGRYFETNFAQGPASGAGGIRAMLLLGNRTTAGSATVDTQIYGPDTTTQCQTEAQVISLFGTGSPLHRAFMRVTAITQTVPIYFVAVTESVGTAATAVFTIANAATADGTFRVWVGDQSTDISISNLDTVATICTNVAAGINAMSKWPVTAAAAATTVTITARTKGPRGNYIRTLAQIISSGTIATTTTNTTDVAMGVAAGGVAGATADSNVAALATILSSRFYWLVSEAEDTTQVISAQTQVNSQANPVTGIRQRAFYGSVDSIGNLTTLATGRNAARGEFVWQKNSLLTPFELAANNAAVYANEESSGASPELSFVEYGNDARSQQYWLVPPQRDISARPTRTDLVSALNNGITPIAVNSRGNATYLVDRITSRSQSGGVPDYRIRPAHKVTVCDFFVDDLAAKTTLQFARKRIADDPKKGAPLPGASVVTPSVYKGCILGLIDDYDNRDMLQDVQLIKNALVVQRETSPRDRMSARIPLRPIDLLKSFAIACDQVA